MNKLLLIMVLLSMLTGCMSQRTTIYQSGSNQKSVTETSVFGFNCLNLAPDYYDQPYQSVPSYHVGYSGPGVGCSSGIPVDCRGQVRFYAMPYYMGGR